jgi:hypothetical protein
MSDTNRMSGTCNDVPKTNVLIAEKSGNAYLTSLMFDLIRCTSILQRTHPFARMPT